MTVREIAATAAVSDWWQCPGASFEQALADAIERDRKPMAGRPGVVRKLLPIRIDESGVFTGGVYLFDSHANAAAFAKWTANDFILDGTPFWQRARILEAHAHSWEVVGAADFKDPDAVQHVMRFQRWVFEAPADTRMLRKEYWATVCEHARDAGLTSAWLLHHPDPYRPQLGLTLTAGRADGSGAGKAADISPLAALESPAAKVAKALGATKVFDRTSWVYVIWFPVSDDEDREPLFPNSPPLVRPAVWAP